MVTDVFVKVPSCRGHLGWEGHVLFTREYRTVEASVCLGIVLPWAVDCDISKKMCGTIITRGSFIRGVSSECSILLRRDQLLF
jgi:hypothetical protein